MTISDISRACSNWSIEITPPGSKKIEKFSNFLDKGTSVNITFLPGTDFNDTIATAKRLSEEGMNPIPHVSVCFDRKIFVENIGLYNNQLSKSEDFEYWLRYILKFGTKKIFKEKEPMTVYNVKGAFIKSRESAISQVYIRFKFFKQYLLSIILLGGIFPNLIRIIFPKLIIKFKYFVTSKKS